jgi:copper chaperone CopZ
MQTVSRVVRVSVWTSAVVGVTIFSGCASSGSGESVEAAASPASSQPESKGDASAPIAASSAVLEVRGMSCPKCANNINRTLAELPGVEDVAIDMGKGEVTVRLTEMGALRPSRAQLAKAITDTGFTLVSIRTP